jgi:ArsR family transcriptional regulator
MNTPPVLSEKMTELVARRFRLLGEPMRLRILQTLEEGERSVSDIVEALGAGQANISKHLQALCHGGLIGRRREGLNIYYRVADPMVFRLCRLVCRSAEEQTRSQLAELNTVTPGNRKSAPPRRRK